MNPAHFKNFWETIKVYGSVLGYQKLFSGGSIEGDGVISPLWIEKKYLC